jgi:WD40 repeat protein
LSHQTAGELGGHTAAINSAVFSPDCKQILTASEDATVRLWDMDSRRVLQVYRGHQAGVTRAIFLSDGRRFLTASRDGTAAVWQTDRDKPDLRLVGHESAVLDIAASGNELFIVTGGADNSARLWDAKTGKELVALRGHSGEVTAVAFAGGEKERSRVLTGSADQTAKLWDVHDALLAPQSDRKAPKELLTLKGHTRSVTSAAFSPDEDSVLTASRDGVAILWPAIDENADSPTKSSTHIEPALTTVTH